MSAFILNHVTLYCTCLKESLAFYQGLLGLELLSGGPIREYAMLETGSCRLILKPTLKPTMGIKKRDKHPIKAALSLTCSDVEAVYNQLTMKGIPFEDPPTRQSWGGLQVTLRDPSGHMLYLASPPPLS